MCGTQTPQKENKEKYVISFPIELCMYKSFADVFINGTSTFHTSGEVEVLSGRQNAYKASKDHGSQHILATN